MILSGSNITFSAAENRNNKSTAIVIINRISENGNPIVISGLNNQNQKDTVTVLGAVVRSFRLLGGLPQIPVQICFKFINAHIRAVDYRSFAGIFRFFINMIKFQSVSVDIEYNLDALIGL